MRAYNRGLLPGAGTAVCASGFAVCKLSNVFVAALLPQEPRTPCGDFFFSEVSPKCLGYNVLVNDFEYRNLYRMLMLEGARISDSLVYQYLNIQGSEDTNQYISKRRMKAEFEIQKEHLIFDGKTCF